MRGVNLPKVSSQSLENIGMGAHLVASTNMLHNSVYRYALQLCRAMT
jgi:hypothetical protein